MSNAAKKGDNSTLMRAYVAIQELEAKVEALERTRREPIAIVGLGCRFPGADGPEAFWELLRLGRDATRGVPPDRWDNAEYYDPAHQVPGKSYVERGGYLDDVAGFDAEFFGLSPREAARMDPQQRLLLEVSWKALENAYIPPPSLAGSQTGVFIGISSYDYSQLLFGDSGRIDAYAVTGNVYRLAAISLSYL